VQKKKFENHPSLQVQVTLTPPPPRVLLPRQPHSKLPFTRPQHQLQ